VDDDDRDPWLSWVPMALYFSGAVYALLGIAFGVGFLGIGGLAATDGTSEGPVVAGMMIAYAVIGGGLMLGWAVVNFLGGWGFSRQAKWGWFVALVMGGIYAPSACFPIGIVLLYGCLNDRTRRTFIG
jgi:hypothetical protein